MATDHLHDTADAFDSVAATYDGPQGNNALVQRMREITWRVVAERVPAGGTLLDIGCGTGIDAEHFASAGYDVIATDWSPEMVARAEARGRRPELGGRVRAQRIGAHELDRLDGVTVDGAYSNFGPLNCVPDLSVTGEALGRLVRPGGSVVVTVIGRVCPWEIVHYAVRGRFSRVAVRFARGETPVGMNGRTIWTRYYTPGEFARALGGPFRVVHVRALSLLVPPPYLTGLHERARPVFDALAKADDVIGGLPVVRTAGDHFLMVLERR